MATKKGKLTEQERWLQFHDVVRDWVPHATAWFIDEERFQELRFKRRDDGTTLAIAKGYGPDGGPVVCFGAGYGLLGSLLAVDRAIQGGNWRVDKPWSPPTKG